MKNLFLIIVLVFLCSKVNAQQKNNTVEVLSNLAARGCGDFKVLRKVKFNGKENTFLILDFSSKKIKLTKKFQSFKLENSSLVSGLVEILNTDKEDNYCTDALSINVKKIESIKLESGKVKVRKISEEKALIKYGHTPYRVDVILENASFKYGEKFYMIEKIEFKNVLVSFMIP
jgi:hypothetical protein